MTLDLFTPVDADALALSGVLSPDLAEITLRSYQFEGLTLSRAAYDSGIYDQLLIAATGSGKTVLMSHLPHFYTDLYRGGMLVLVHRDELVRQTVEKFTRFNPRAVVTVEKAEERAAPGANLVVASVQTLGRSGSPRLERLLSMYDFGLVVVDEVHHATPRSQYDNVLSALGLGSRRTKEPLMASGRTRLLLGVTATPNRHDRVGLSHFFSQIVATYDLRFLVHEGYLCEPVPHVIETGTTLEGVGSRMGDFQQGALGRRVNNEDRNNLIVSTHLKECPGKSALAFCASVEHAHELAARFEMAGVSAVAIDQNTPREERRSILRAHEEGEIEVVTNFGLLVEGYDGRVHVIHQARPTKSESLYQQMIGRGLRTIPSDLGNLATRQERLAAIAASPKPAALIFDYVDMGHGLVTLPSLYGIAPKFKAKGKKLFSEVIEPIEEAIGEAGWNEEAIRSAESFEQVEYAKRRVDVWQVAKSMNALKEESKNRWMRVAEDVYQLDVPPTDEQPERMILRIEPDALGRYRATAIFPRRVERPAPGEEGADRIVPERREQFTEGAFEDLAACVKACDERVARERPGTETLTRTFQPWRMHRPTDGQLRYLRSLGIDTSEVRSKGTASDLITAHKMVQMQRAA